MLSWTPGGEKRKIMFAIYSGSYYGAWVQSGQQIIREDHEILD